MAFMKLSHIQIDALKEIGNIAAGNAATSLSMLTNKKIDMNVPKVILVPFSEVMDIIGNPEEPIVSIHFRILGEAPGMVYFVLTVEEAEQLAQQLTGDKTFDLLQSFLISDNEMAFSALMETGNILAGTYLSALADFTKIHMQPSIPTLNVDMAGAILSVGLIETSEVTDHAIVIDTSIHDQGIENGICGKFFMMPHADAIPKIFQALGLNENEEWK